MDAERFTPLPHRLTSIIIVTHNQPSYTRHCIDSVIRHTREPFEFIFVDNGSTDGTVEYLQQLGQGAHESVTSGSLGRITIVSNASNRGFPAAANQGIQVSQGAQILLLNNDTIVTDAWLTRMLRAIRSDTTIGMVGPCSNFVSGDQCVPVPYGPRAGSAEWATGTADEFIHEYAPELDAFADEYGRTNDGLVTDSQRLVGFCMLIRREVIDRIGLLDERFGIGNFEDDDYCRRAREAGFRLVIARDAFVHHFGGRTFLGANVAHGELMNRNERLFKEKWERLSAVSSQPAPPKTENDDVAHSDGVENSIPTLQISDPTIVSADPAIVICPPSTDRSFPLLSLCMIARDNERTIAVALETIRRYVDDMVVLDTGSTDRTAEIAGNLGARVFSFPWCDDFSAARNESVRHALGQWIFWMDTDDSIDDTNARKVRHVVSALIPRNVMGFTAKVRCPEPNGNWGSGFVEVDHIKIFRNLPQLRFEGRIHEQILMPIRRAGGTFEWTDIFVTHSGADYSSAGRAKKLERDMRILELEYRDRPDHPFVLFNLGMTYTEAGRFPEAIGFLWQSIGRASPDESHLRKAFAHLVSCYERLGRSNTALETCEQGLKRFPLDRELMFLQGCLLRRLGRLPQAAQVFETLRQSQEERHLSSVDHGMKGYRSLHQLAEIYTELGDVAKAEKCRTLMTAG